MEKILIFFDRGGMWMWAILAFQLVSLVIIIERVYFLYFKRKRWNKGWVEEVGLLVKKGQLDQVLKLTEGHLQKDPVARVALAGTQVAAELGGKEEILGKMDEVLLSETSHLERRIGFLPMLGNVATLTGLLGTITGMITAFVAVSRASPSEKAELLSAGISEAMNTTAYGLIVAIPALIMYSVLQNRANTLIEDLKQSSLRIYNWLAFSCEPVTDKKAMLEQQDSIVV
ncbi:MAG: MotA/TolQ/ExbB proton channel family protein [Bdellovibrionaceae bacterium]|nr:MotA/TolQ/ExbB proton channel family protein [Pseudobdellovibrionaceae bacterium]MDW8191049.1 MotA/TolQ/ExbB proton channel family protein [Pseudobdellovibrionaceae bacterium]